MVYYVLIKVIINALSLAEAIINIEMRYHSLSKLIITNQGLLFISKFWLLLCYFFNIKWKLSITFYLQIDNQIKK